MSRVRLLSLLDQMAWRDWRRPGAMGGEEVLVVATSSCDSMSIESLVMAGGVIVFKAMKGFSSPRPKARRLALSAAGRGDDASLCRRTGGLGASAQIGVRGRLSGDEEVVVGSWLSWAIGSEEDSKVDASRCAGARVAVVGFLVFLTRLIVEESASVTF